MFNSAESGKLIKEFNHERSIRRTVKLLENKHKRIKDDLEQLISHISLLVPIAGLSASDPRYNDLLIDAITRLENEPFAQLLLQLIQNK